MNRSVKYRSALQYKVLVLKLLSKVLVVSVLSGLPLLGIVLAGQKADLYGEFPPLTRYVQHAEFSGPIFIGMAVLILMVTGPFIYHWLQALSKDKRNNSRTGKYSSFPWWGWLGLVVGAIFLVLAWNRFSWFSEFQIYTFIPLWFAYILIVNAWCYKRTSQCLMLDRPYYFLGLFILSSVFWWFFEYLNRFVENWYYLNIGTLDSLEYLIFASISFATVLPALLSTYQLLGSCSFLHMGMNKFLKLRFIEDKRAAVILLLLFGAGLLGIGVYPDYLYPLLWLSPLVLVVCVQILLGEKTVFSSVKYGDWTRIWLLGLAALTCGLFWEMWNFYSLAKWEYSIPFVHKFKIFEMPLLGYAGYLPFGLECWVVADFFLRPIRTSNQ
ncbi:MAG: hypothetical protein AAGA18_05250 [Verrucomicrobiota bacterium]